MPFFGYVFICIVSRGRTHGVLLRLFKCRVIKIINCCHGKCGRSRPLPGRRVGRGTRPTHHSFRAAAGADADLRKSAPRIMHGPRFATPGAGQIVKEQIHAQSIQAWLNLLQRALYPIIRSESRHHFRIARTFSASPNSCGNFPFRCATICTGPSHPPLFPGTRRPLPAVPHFVG